MRPRGIRVQGKVCQRVGPRITRNNGWESSCPRIGILCNICPLAFQHCNTRVSADQRLLWVSQSSPCWVESLLTLSYSCSITEYLYVGLSIRQTTCCFSSQVFHLRSRKCSGKSHLFLRDMEWHEINDRSDFGLPSVRSSSRCSACGKKGTKDVWWPEEFAVVGTVTVHQQAHCALLQSPQPKPLAGNFPILQCLSELSVSRFCKPYKTSLDVFPILPVLLNVFVQISITYSLHFCEHIWGCSFFVWEEF